MYKIACILLIISFFFFFFCHFSFEMANLGRLSKVYTAKMLLLRTWGSLVNIVKVGGKNLFFMEYS